MIKSPRREAWERAFLGYGLRPNHETRGGRWVFWSTPGVPSGVGFFALIWSDGFATVARRRRGSSVRCEVVFAAEPDVAGEEYEPGGIRGVRVPGKETGNRLPLPGSDFEAKLLRRVAIWTFSRAKETVFAQAADRQLRGLRRLVRREIAGGDPVDRDEYLDLSVALARGGTPNGWLERVGFGSGPLSVDERRDVGTALCLSEREVWEFMRDESVIPEGYDDPGPLPKDPNVGWWPNRYVGELYDLCPKCERPVRVSDERCPHRDCHVWYTREEDEF